MKSSKEMVLSVYPDAFSWQDEDGQWYVSLPHLGDAETDEAAWDDAASRLTVTAEAKFISPEYASKLPSSPAGEMGSVGETVGSSAKWNWVPEPVPPGGAADHVVSKLWCHTHNCHLWKCDPGYYQPSAPEAASTKSSSYHEHLIQALRDPTEAISYLQAACDEGIEDFRKALSNVSESHLAAPIAPSAQELRIALVQAAQSLHTIAEQAGRDEYLRNMEQVRGYAYSRALAADDLIARYFAARAERREGEAKHG